MKIDVNKVVTLTYELTVEGEVVESVDVSRPFTFIHGTGYLLPKFEENIQGLIAGDEFSFDVKCAEAYGPASEDNVVELPKNIFEVDGKMDTNVVAPGNVVPMLDAEGNKHHGIVLEITDANVVMDFNHPMAGDDLSFKGKVIEVREATAEELAQGHVHQNNGGCGCDDTQAANCDDKSESCGCGC